MNTSAQAHACQINRNCLTQDSYQVILGSACLQTRTALEWLDIWKTSASWEHEAVFGSLRRSLSYL